MDQTKERKVSFSSSRPRSRGIVPKESSGIWKVENEGIDSIGERYRIKDHRLNGKTRRSRLVSTESSDESFDEEMAEERNGQAEIKETKLKGYDEIVIGVPVPRRARSGLKRRVQSFVTAQPSNGSKESGEEKVPLSETEVEVAKLLFGLTKLHSQFSDATSDTFQDSSVPDMSALSKGSKRKKSKHLQSDDAAKPSMTITSNSKSGVTIDRVNATSSVPFSSMNGKLAVISSTTKKVAISSTKFDKISSSNSSGQSKIETPWLGPSNVVSLLAEEKPGPISSIMSQSFESAIHHGQAKPILLNKGYRDSNANCETEHKQYEQLTVKELDQVKQELPPHSSQNKKLDPHKCASSVSSVKDCEKKMKYEIDLMSLPVDATDECKPKVSDINLGSSNDENICKRGTSGFSRKLDIEDSKSKQNSGVLHELRMKEATKEGMEKQSRIEWRTVSCQDCDDANKVSAKNHFGKIVRDISHPSRSAGLLKNNMTAISTPFPLSLSCWPGAIRPYGSPSTGSASLSVDPAPQGANLVEGNTLMPHAPLVMLPPMRPNHCATHCYIARLIHFQQQLVKLNTFCHAASSSDKPCNVSAVPQPGALILGGPVIINPNAIINGSSKSGSMLPLNSQYPVPNHSDALKDAEKGRHSLQQSHQGGFFLIPINQIQSQAPGQKTSDLSQIRELVSTSDASSALASTSTSCSNLAVIPDSRHLTMFKGNSPFLNTPAYQSYIAQHQRPPLPLFHGSSNPSQLYPHSLQLTRNPTASSGPSFEKCLQDKQFLLSPKTSLEAYHNKPEHSRNCGITQSQGTLQNYSLQAGKHLQLPPLSLLTNQAKELSKVNSSTSGSPSELNHFRKQVTAQTNSPISTLSTSVSVTSSVTYSDQTKPQERLCSLQNTSKPETSLENTSSRKVTPVHSLIDAVKAQTASFSNLVPGHQNSSIHLTFPGSQNMRKPTVNEQALLTSSIGLATVSAVSSVRGAASLPIKSAKEKPAAA